MIIKDLKDFVDLINYIAEDSTKEHQKINTEGLSKFKESLYEVLQYVETPISPESLTPLKKNLFDALKKVSPEERHSLSQAMLTSYFTPDHIVGSMTKSIENYWKDHNLETINICEPSAGSGKFLAPLVKDNTSLDAIELDLFTAKILKNNFSSPNVQIHNMGYENFIPNKQYDLIVGNVPFGNYKVYDKALSEEKKDIINGKIHNYFFLKSLENLKPGGVLMLLTTAAMNNAAEERKLRESLMAESNLISCIRFSDTTFKESKTKVVSDLIVLQKPLAPKKNNSEREKDFINTTPFFEGNDLFPINQYLKNYPENILGEPYITKGFLGKDTLSVLETKESNTIEVLPKILENDFNKYALKQLLDIELSNRNESVNINESTLKNEEILKDYPYAVPGNIIFQNNSFYHVTVNKNSIDFLDREPLSVHLKDQEKVLLLIELRETYKKLREEIRNNNQPKIKLYQSQLEDQYNIFSFVADYINSKSNVKILAYEAERDLLRGLEVKENENYIKSHIFTRDYSKEKKTEVSAQTIEDSIALSFHKYGKLNQDYITLIYGKDFESWAKEALQKELLYINPIIKNLSEIEGYELAIPSKFKSNYIEGKLSIYQNQSLLLKENQYAFLFDKSIIDKAKNALVDAVPFKLNIAEINPGMGEPWVDISIYEMFGKEHFLDERFQINHIHSLDKFKISSGYSSFGNANYTVDTNNNRVSYTKIFEYALIHTIPDYKKTVYIGDKETKIADKETINAVLLSVEKLNKEFSNWLLTKKGLCESLENKYHLLNNAIVKENFNISLLNFDDLNGLKPYEHQKNAVWQNISQMGGIIDHEVGFGKTLTMAMTTMKKKQFGLIHKELVCGLNANYAAIYETYKAVYPKGKFLLVEPSDLVPEKKQETFYKIANNDWDAVITAHSCLMKFPIAPYAQQEILKETINEIKATVDNSDFSRILSRGEINNLNKKLLDAEASYKYATDIINEKKEKGTLIFDDLGIDSLTVDESHEFKNLSFTTKHSRVAGLGNQSEVQKTSNLLSYVRYLQGIHKGDKGVTFASGTTISNSITELYLLFKYLRPTMLKEKGMNNFDQWARVFARKTNEYEESVTGMIKQKERFRYFVKVPELAKMYNDITNYADFNTFKINRPQAKTNLIAIEPYKEQLEYFEKIKRFGETKNLNELSGKAVNADRNVSKAVGLICTNLGKKASLSLKLIDPNYPDHPKDKIHTMASYVLDYHLKYDADRGTQLIFCDQGVPGSANYNLYAYIKAILIEKGIKSEEIAFIHDWDKKKEALFAKVNSGEIRVLLGSTPKMGVGVNVQQKLVALHHIDFPWRPTDLVQRNGRGERPGNILLPSYDNVLNVNFYATKQSLDSYTFNLLQIKHNFILQIKNASISTRVIDEGLIDVNGGMNFSEYMAACSSNQYLTQRLQLEKKLNSLVDIKNSYELNHRQKLNKLSFILDDIKKSEKTIEKLSVDLKESLQVKCNNIDGTLFSSDKQVAAYLRSQLDKKFQTNDFAVPFVNLSNGFGLIVAPKSSNWPIDKDHHHILLVTPNNYKIGFKSNCFTKDDKDVSAYAKNCIDRITVLLDNEKGKLKDNQEAKIEIEKVLANKTDKNDEIKSLQNEIAKIDILIEKENKKNNPDNDDDLNKGKGNKPKL